MTGVADALLAWHARHGRNDLPWQHPRNAYRVWIAEIMLQQTQVRVVIDYFRRFMDTLPTLAHLAGASEDDVMALWSGLGYYRRARFAHAAARQCVAQHGGELPRNLDALMALPGIGRSTAGAILAQAHGLRFPILDGNVKRVLARYHGVRGHPGRSAVEKQLWTYAEQHTPDRALADYTQAIMDLGATVCTRRRPGCDRCPLAADCIARRHGLTAQLPEPRPSKTLPTRDTCMLALRDTSGRILLERRRGPGVWSGLWSLPEAADSNAATTMAARYAGIAEVSELPAFTHVFSHYRLNVRPHVFAEATPRPSIADNDDMRWCWREDARALGLPAPVRTLLDTIWTT